MKQTSFPDSFIPQALKTFDALENQGTRLVFINGVQVYCLELADEVSCRHAAVQLYLCWHITQKEIASALENDGSDNKQLGKELSSSRG